jgi:toxin secretion/phage lysis holin
MNKIKTGFIAVFSALSSWLGILFIPVFMLLGANIIDYITGIWAAPYRQQKVKSYKSIRGIQKKVGMYILIIIGAALDFLLKYATQYIGIDLKINFIVAIVITIWLLANELISIIENLIDIDVKMPKFLMPLVKLIRDTADKQVKSEANTSE